MLSVQVCHVVSVSLIMLSLQVCNVIHHQCVAYIILVLI